MSKKSFGPTTIFLFAIAIIGIVVLNRWIQGKVGHIIDDAAKVDPLTVALQKRVPSKPKVRTGDVIRRTRLAPERTFETSIFYQDGDEIARHRVTRKGVVYDQVGKIPDGKVKFISENDKTYGVEYYQGGLKHGRVRINYEDGNTKIEANYQNGKLMTRKEFYHDGTLKMEEDYNDARAYDDGREVGDGKVYARGGKIKYEWHLTNSDPVGYHKSYNTGGNLTSAVYYDKDGIVVPSKPARIPALKTGLSSPALNTNL